MTHFELAEQLRLKTGVTFEEAKEALEQSNWDLLDAALFLEKQGKLHDHAQQEARAKDAAPAAKGEGIRVLLGKVGDKIISAVNYLCRNSFEISRHEKTLITLPVLVLLLCLIFLFWPTLILLIAGLFFSFRYAFRGPDLGKERINRAMDKAAGVAESIREDVSHSAEENNSSGQDQP